MHDVRYMVEHDLRGARGSQLLHYLLRRGADEFTIRVMALQDTLAPFVDAFEDELGPYEGDVALRRVVMTDPPHARFQPVRVWSLTGESLPKLLSFLDEGLFHVPAGPDGWFEDLTVYRYGALVLGVVSHEREGVLWLSSDEYNAITQFDISVVPPSQWSGTIVFNP